MEKVAFISGANRGIGFETSKKLAEQNLTHCRYWVVLDHKSLWAQIIFMPKGHSRLSNFRTIVVFMIDNATLS